MQIICRIVPGIQRAGLGVRVQRESQGSDSSNVCPKRVLLPSERNIFYFEERVHGLGQTCAEPSKCTRRDARGKTSKLIK